MIRLFPAIVCALVLSLSLASEAFALDPARTIVQFKHTAWTLDDGAPGRIQAIAQSKDGSLWLGTATGLYRFDGLGFERIPSFSGKPARSDSVWALMVARNGDVWVGHLWGGVSVYRNGRLEDARDTQLVGRVRSIVEDRSGAIWVGSDGSNYASVQRFSGGKWTSIDARWGIPKEHLHAIVGMRNGDLWFCFDRALMRLPFGARRAQTIVNTQTIAPGVAESRDGRIWTFDSSGFHELPRDLRAASSGGVAPETSDSSVFNRLIVDRDGALWSVNLLDGVHRVRHPEGSPAGYAVPGQATENFSQADGLTSARAIAIFEDRESNIWVGTLRGLDRFRAAPVVKELTLTSVPVNAAASIASARGKIYGVTYDETGGRIFEVAPRGALAFSASFVPPASALCPATDGGVWLVSGDPPVLMHVADGRVLRTPFPPATTNFQGADCVEDARGRVWISSYGAGLAHFIYRYDGKGWDTFDGNGRFAGIAPWPMETDPQGRVLIYYAPKFLVRVDHDTAKVVWNQKDIAISWIHVIYSGRRYVLLGGESGLARYDGTTFKVLSSARFPFLGHVTGIAQTKAGDTWLIGISGIVRLSTQELDAAFDDPDRGLAPRIFNAQDGLVGAAEDSRYNHIAIGADGRVWFITADGFFWIDPKTLYPNRLPPPVSIRSLSSGSTLYAPADGLALPEGTSHVDVDYAAMSLSLPERIRYRYRLDGIDAAWIDPGRRRAAIYTNLGPGTYRFHVIASNNDGVWNAQGATLTFVIPPTFLQSNLFFTLCVLAGAALLWLLYLLRLRQVTAGIRTRMEERLAERERIARELHDTLLQGIDGLILKFQSIANRMQPDAPMRKMMDDALERADDVLAESRDSMRDLRPAQNQRELSDAFAAAGEMRGSASTAKFRVVREGTVARLHPIARNEIARIGGEAIANAFRHAGAANIEVSVVYLANKLVVTVTDDGTGIAQSVLQEGRQGHFGLTGMRERAARLGADFSVASRVGSGTTVTLTVPAAIAYAEASGRQKRSWLPGPFLSSPDA